MSHRQATSRKLLGSLLMAAAWLVLGMTNAHAGNTVTKVTLVMTDAQGNVLMTKDTQGHILARYTYRPYGTQQSGPTNRGPGYTGHVNDPDTGLVYMQQRYYDPAVGRFISPDPVVPTPGNVFNFGRYTYANNNPMRYTDPTGMYTCDRKKNKEFCKRMDARVKHLRSSRDHYRPGSRGYRLISLIINFVGEKGIGGPEFLKGSLPGTVAARSNQHGKITIDESKGTNPDMMASDIGHEAQHGLDAKNNGAVGNTNNPETARSQFEDREKRAYNTQKVILGGYGKTLTNDQIQKAVMGSVKYDMSGWNKSHKNIGGGE